MNRDEEIMALRPIIQIDSTKTSLAEENFQNNTLRPILKFQHHTIQFLAEQALKGKSIPLEANERIALAKQILQNHLLKQKLFGVVIALFTADELAFYVQHETAINKRISQLLVKRLADSL